MKFSEHVAEVEEFMEKHKFSVDQDLTEQVVIKPEIDLMSDAASMLFMISKDIEDYMKKHYVYHKGLARVQLHTEELAEMIEALILRDEVALLDGLSDLQFITIGTALTFDMPLEEGHKEVCRSNLTKDVCDLSSNTRLRDKGPNYGPPQLKEILEGYRNGDM